MTVSQPARVAAARWVSWCWLMVACIGVLGCGSDGGEVLDCSGAADCPDNLLCIRGLCGAPDERLCTTDTDCSDDMFCNGQERCDPAEISSSRLGCVSGSAPTCAFGCDEVVNACSPCESDADCFNGDFCGGLRTCNPTAADAGPDGCVAPSERACTNPAACDENIARCCDEDRDGDRSVACGGGDCDDANPARASTLTEVCDGRFVDQDCDDATDGCTPGSGPLDCPDAGSEVAYYYDAFNIPGAGDARLGFDLDGVVNACAIDDFPGSVDNAWIGLADELTGLGIFLRDLIDTARANCSFQHEIRVRLGSRCGIVNILDTATGASMMGGPFFVRIDDGVMTGRAPSFEVRVPYFSLFLSIAVADAHFRATLDETGLSDLLIGGGQSFSGAADLLVPLIGLSRESVEHSLTNFVDLANASGTCSRAGSISVGFGGHADPHPPACPRTSGR